jgi:hypothetical protein
MDNKETQELAGFAKLAYDIIEALTGTTEHIGLMKVGDIIRVRTRYGDTYCCEISGFKNGMVITKPSGQAVSFSNIVAVYDLTEQEKQDTLDKQNKASVSIDDAMEFCRKKLEQNQQRWGKKQEGYEEAILAVMSYLSNQRRST